MRIILDTNCLIQSIPSRIAGNARYIVTDDHHYDILRNTVFPHVDVLSIKQFLALIK